MPYIDPMEHFFSEYMYIYIQIKSLTYHLILDNISYCNLTAYLYVAGEGDRSLSEIFHQPEPRKGRMPLTDPLE